MNPKAEQKLKELAEKDINALTDADKVFLKARRSYLTAEQKETLKEVIKEQKAEVKKDKEVKQAEKAEKIEKQNYRDLQGRASKLGLPYVGVSKADLIASIQTAEGPASGIMPE